MSFIQSLALAVLCIFYGVLSGAIFVHEDIQERAGSWLVFTLLIAVPVVCMYFIMKG